MLPLLFSLAFAAGPWLRIWGGRPRRRFFRRRRPPETEVERRRTKFTVELPLSVYLEMSGLPLPLAPCRTQEALTAKNGEMWWWRVAEDDEEEEEGRAGGEGTEAEAAEGPPSGGAAW